MDAANLPTPEELARKIHNTVVAPEATLADIRLCCDDVKALGFGAAVVQGCWTGQAREFLDGKSKLSVALGFPMGGATTTSKAEEIRETGGLGADMYDCMPNIGFLKSGMEDEFRRDIEAMVRAAEGRPVRVMLELALLTPTEKIRAARLSEAAGVAGVKNSSGWGRGGAATVEDVRLLRSTVGPSVHVKASGGIRDLDKALALLGAGADFLGTRSGPEIIRQLRERKGL